MRSLALYGPKSLTLQANFTLRPAGTVIFPISSTNSGSGTVVTETTVTETKWNEIVNIMLILSWAFNQNWISLSNINVQI